MKKRIISVLAAILSMNTAFSGVRTFTVGDFSFDMIDVEGGTFYMGATEGEQNYDAKADDDKEGPVHQVTVSDFTIGKFPVTQEIYFMITQKEPHDESTSSVWDESLGYGVGYPAYYLNWHDAEKFIEKLNEKLRKDGQISGTQKFDMPTEAEWEFAARGGNLSQGFRYAGSDNPDEVAWFPANSSEQTHIVGQKKPNELGLYDMSGNVAEWCKDYYYRYCETKNGEKNCYYGYQYKTDPEKKVPHITLGQYCYILRNGVGYAERDTDKLRIASRTYLTENTRMSYNGVRLVLRGTPEKVPDTEENPNPNPDKGESTGIENMENNTMFHVEHFAKNVLHVTNATVGSTALLLSVSGKELQRIVVSQPDFDINISEQKSGIYILRIGGKSVKFVKK